MDLGKHDMVAAILAICLGCASAGSPPPEPPAGEMQRPSAPCHGDRPRVESQAGFSAKDLARIRDLVEETPERPIIRIGEWQNQLDPPRRIAHAQMAIQVTVLVHQSCDATSGENEEFFLEKTVDTWTLIARRAVRFIE